MLNWFVGGKTTTTKLDNVQFLSVQSEGRFDRIYDRMLYVPLSSSQCGNLHICRFKGSVHQDASVYPDQYPSAYDTLNNLLCTKIVNVKYSLQVKKMKKTQNKRNLVVKLQIPFPSGRRRFL